MTPRKIRGVRQLVLWGMIGMSLLGSIFYALSSHSVPPMATLAKHSNQKIMKITQNEVANWMQGLPDHRALGNIMMPGSHDAGMSELHHCNPIVGADGSTKTQGGSVGDQLRWGSRYFDIRVDQDHGELVTYHRTSAFGCNGQPLQAVLDETVQFLQTHPSEFALLKFSHIRDYRNHHPDTIKAAIDALLSQPNYQPYCYTHAANAVGLATIPVGNLRGKMVVLYDYPQGVSLSTGRFRYQDYTQPLPTAANIVVYDQYSNTDQYETMASDQLQKWQVHAGQTPVYLFLLSWTLTATKGPLSGSVAALATEANGHLPTVLHQQIVTQQLPLPNIVYTDFMNAATAAAIVQYNFTSI